MNLSVYALRLAERIYPLVLESFPRLRENHPADGLQSELFGMVSIIMVEVQKIDEVTRGVDKKNLTRRVGHILLERLLPDESPVMDVYDRYINDMIETLYWTAHHWRRRSCLYRFCCM